MKVGDMEVKQAAIVEPDGSVTVDGVPVDPQNAAREGMVLLKTSIEAMLDGLRHPDSRPYNKDSFKMNRLTREKMIASLRETADLLESGKKQKNVEPVSAAATSPKGYTIYMKGPLGSIVKEEAKSIEMVQDSYGVEFVAVRGRRTRVVMSYYSPFILVCEGRNLPDPASAWQGQQTGENGVTTQQGRMRSQDPRWVSEFEAMLPSSVKQLVLFKNGKLVFNKIEAETTPPPKEPRW